MSQENFLTQQHIENRIFTIRGTQVMLDSVLAEMYQTETKYINRAVKRNPDRFPTSFVFQLSELEWNDLKFQSVTTSGHGGRRSLPYAFTEQGVAMLSSVLQTQTAIKVSILIMNAFIEMRKFLNNHSGLMQRMTFIEQKQLETDHQFEQVFKALENKSHIPSQGVFFDGQVFDAYELTSKIIRSAQKSLILIDNFIDESTLSHLAKKENGVKVLLLSKKLDSSLTLDVKKANEQYGGFILKHFPNSHDRFLIIDHSEVYHLGASLKDLGKKWFAFSKLESVSVESVLKQIEKLS